MKDRKSVLLLLALIIFFVYVLRHFLGKVSSLFFVPIDRLLFISHGVSPVIMWMFLGFFIGLIYGSFIAIKKFKLDFKLLVYPIAILIIILSLILLAFFIKNKPEKDLQKSNSGAESDKGVKQDIISKSILEFNEALNKGVLAVKNEEYGEAEGHFKEAVYIDKNNSQLDSLAKIYTKIANDDCALFQFDKKLKYIPNHYYKYAAILTSELTPQVCK